VDERVADPEAPHVARAVSRGLEHSPGPGPSSQHGIEALWLGPDAPLEAVAALLRASAGVNRAALAGWPRRLAWDAYLAYHLRGQARFPFRPLPAVRQAQQQRLRSMLTYAERHVPYYRETLRRLGLRAADFREAEDLARLPILERAQLQRDPEYFLSTAQRRQDCLEMHSSGSTGEPLTIFHDRAAVFQNAAHAERERSMITTRLGRSAGYRELVLASRHGDRGTVQGFLAERGYFPPGLRIQRAYVGLHEPPERAVAALNRFRPHLVHGLGSSLALLFAHLEATGTAVHRPRAITFSSDALPDPARHLIESTFGIPVFGAYQAVEAFKIGFECRRSLALHLNVDLYPLRIVDTDGRTLPPGERGEVVVSNLVNRANVVLNYRLGDVAALLPDRCPCGRTLPLLSLPEGRSDDWLRLGDGRLLHAQAVHPAIKREAVWQYQVVQHGEADVQVLVVPAQGCDRAQAAARIRAGLASQLGEGARVEVAFVDAIDLRATGKHRVVVSPAGRAALGLVAAPER